MQCGTNLGTPSSDILLNFSNSLQTHTSLVSINAILCTCVKNNNKNIKFTKNSSDSINVQDISLVPKLFFAEALTCDEN